MQNNPQELSWQAIQAIVGVKLPSNVLRFDDIGFHLVKNSVSSADDSDSDVEIVENDWESDNNVSSKAEHSDNEKTSPDRALSESPVLHLVEPENNNSSKLPLDYKYLDKIDTKDISEGDQIMTQLNDDGDNSNGNVMSIENYLEVTLSTDPEASHLCSQCNQTFPSEHLLSSHKCAKTDDKKCHVCSEKFPTYWELKKHIDIHIPGMLENYLEVTLSTDPDASHACSQCNQKFPSEQLLSSHQCAKPTEEKKCHMCSKKFPTYWELKKHIESHFPGMLDSKSSFCHLCQKDYTKTGFMNHLRKHTGERPFVCELCNKAFSQSSSLSIHMKFHLNVRKHACTVCEKKFVTKSELSRHMTVHTKQKSYYCGVCDKAFTRSDNMKKHEKTHG